MSRYFQSHLLHICMMYMTKGYHFENKIEQKAQISLYFVHLIRKIDDTIQAKEVTHWIARQHTLIKTPS